ncbi:TetR family transcriptional regulator [Pseudoclavibacter sp. RFBJ3]|uniref:TetR/AcrR family transcriptional regulator n=1 Tax=unclassified Pseudoclavibacter TaxID=2615177 RepID=UPI000CE8F47B|nr:MULTISPECIES: TetR/AcrR family transcriptional regulator [unclassified Pseudoclavibacter]PPF81386.1 TetR family transcriptional regulator [Pseudoclavibacter sp. RFBJ5]PPF90717.1 TetR family transcriptional regulator [Pseudoclavibacter sp. RFBJ3]PPG00903.1 TetR family transcriptional regulator [Pseudoclavibacter sp. RFBH5]PPG21014.1 TetR family transcriptional regulator [Pseudoclavibacter sp. RFBI4]
MTTDARPMGRRERNKLDKLERITAAAGELFAERGVDDVTTQEIADRADIGTGTLFLYAKTKGELLLLVQNSMYEAALEEGRAAVAETTGALDGVLAVLRPVVACNRKQIENGRTYLREMVFGDPEEPRHAEALALTSQTQDLVADVIERETAATNDTARTLAQVVSAIMFTTMAASINASLSDDDLVEQVRAQVRAVLPA